MKFPVNFIKRTHERNSLQSHVPAPLFRKTFTIEHLPENAQITICGLGFYKLYVNGKDVTKGLLAPYISNPDDIVYYDRYDIREHLAQGENAVGIILGNGMQNTLNETWDFVRNRWNSAPRLALEILLDDITISSDTSFKTHSSPITFDDLRLGEDYDARLELENWTSPQFDDTDWAYALPAEAPRGEFRLVTAEPIVTTTKLRPVTVEKHMEGHLYDFGVNAAGLCELNIDGNEDQQLTMLYDEHLANGTFDTEHNKFDLDPRSQMVNYTCKQGQQSYIPHFTYCGFRYVYIKGLTDVQATPDLLTYHVMNSDLKEKGNFNCSDDVANTLQALTRRSTLANFYYFPTDCPHREKNGWTGDAALSAEHTLLNLTPENSYREWLHNVRKAQNEAGTLPGIVPTGGWGFEWGNGPAWDCALTYLPYFTYVYRGDVGILRENATAIFRYINYLSNNLNGQGLITLGLGDWCPPGRPADGYKAPLVVTDSIISLDICRKASSIFNLLNMPLQRSFTDTLALFLRENIRAHLVDFGTMTVLGDCQTSQAMGIFYDIFEPGEKSQAFLRLLDMIERADQHMDVGILGGRVLFHVLSDFGEADLAYKLITQESWPSYGNWVARGATSLWEKFEEDGAVKVVSLNHHFWGDISGWFIKAILGINVVSPNEVEIAPNFIEKLTFAKGYHADIQIEWIRKGQSIELTVDTNAKRKGWIKLPSGCTFDDGLAVKPLKTGKYIVNI